MKESQETPRQDPCEEHESLAEKYPWFDAAHRANNSAKDLPVHIKLTDSFRLGKRTGRTIPVAGHSQNKPPGQEEQYSIIDKFLEKGEYRIVPGKDTPEVPLGSRMVSEFNGDDEFLTEEMAEIYVRQEQYAKAVEIYERLSLLNPEKSIYFADVIAQIDAEITNN